MPLRKRKPRKAKATHELVDLEVQKVDLVGVPATGDTFLVMRSEDPNGEEVEPDLPPPTKEKVQDQLPEITLSIDGKKVGTIVQTEEQTLEEKTEKAEKAEGTEEKGNNLERQRVPAATASNEEKRQAQMERSRRFNIEALEGKGENLSYPSGSPTVLSLYGDPVNLKYPLGRENNRLDLARANNARARFKQAADVYSQTQSKRVIHTRIVRAQLQGGADPSYNPEDPLDRLLPRDIKDRLQRSEEALQAAERLMQDPLDVAYRDDVVRALTSIVDETLGLIREVQDFPVTEGGEKNLPEDTLELINGLGIQVARASIQMAIAEEDLDPAIALWNSIKRAGAKMSRTRLQKFKSALDVLGSILSELEGSEEREMSEEQVKEEKVSEAPETAPKDEKVKEPKVEREKEEEKNPNEEILKILRELQVNSKETKEQMANLAERLEKVERSAGIPNGDSEPEDTQKVDREEKPFWGGITGIKAK